MRTEKCTKGARFNRNEHVSQIHIRLLFVQIVSIFSCGFFKIVSILLRSMMQSPAHITKNAVKNVWKRSKSAPIDRCYPISVSTTRFGLSKQEHFTFVSFHGQSLRPWRQAHDSFRNIYFTLSCFLLRNLEISRTLHAISLRRWCRCRRKNIYDMRKHRRREGVNAIEWTAAGQCCQRCSGVDNQRKSNSWGFVLQSISGAASDEVYQRTVLWHWRIGSGRYDQIGNCRNADAVLCNTDLTEGTRCVRDNEDGLFQRTPHFSLMNIS